LLIKISSGIVMGGLMIAAPLIALMFFVTTAVGFLVRAVQGLNLFVESIGLRLLIGGAGLLIFLPLILNMARGQMERLLPLSLEYLGVGAKG
jgi:flagellar biosynthesis protein FliR